MQRIWTMTACLAAFATATLAPSQGAPSAPNAPPAAALAPSDEEWAFHGRRGWNAILGEESIRHLARDLALTDERAASLHDAWKQYLRDLVARARKLTEEGQALMRAWENEHIPGLADDGVLATLAPDEAERVRRMREQRTGSEPLLPNDPEFRKFADRRSANLNAEVVRTESELRSRVADHATQLTAAAASSDALAARVRDRLMIEAMGSGLAEVDLVRPILRGGRVWFDWYGMLATACGTGGPLQAVGVAALQLDSPDEAAAHAAVRLAIAQSEEALAAANREWLVAVVAMTRDSARASEAEEERSRASDRAISAAARAVVVARWQGVERIAAALGKSDPQLASDWQQFAARQLFPEEFQPDAVDRFVKERVEPARDSSLAQRAQEPLRDFRSKRWELQRRACEARVNGTVFVDGPSAGTSEALAEIARARAALEASTVEELEALAAPGAGTPGR